MGATSLHHGKSVTAAEVQEMRRRHAEGQGINYIAAAMGRSWTSVNRYVRGLSWVETRNPERSPEQHRAYFRERQRQYREHGGAVHARYVEHL